MLGTTSNNTASTPGRHDTAKNWLHRRLWKPASRQLLGVNDTGGVRRKLSLKRPQTAPPSQRATRDTVPPVPQIPINIKLPSPRLAIHPPPRPPRPDSGVIRDVNAWLDTSTNMPPPLAPLMGGLPYWKSTSAVPSLTSPGVQYAIPIIREPGPSRPVTPSSQQVKSICRRGAKKVQAKMPSLLRTTSQSMTTRKQINRRSNSMPLLAIPFEQARQATPRTLLARSSSFRFASARTSMLKTLTDEQPLLSASRNSVELPVLGSTRTSVTGGGVEGHSDRRLIALVRHTTRSGDNTRPCTAGAHLSRDESMGDLSLSEAPTYSSGRPPPSYRSRTASIRTTSSFGCVDGISSAQKHVAQPRTAMRSRGVRGRVRELRKMFHNE